MSDSAEHAASVAGLSDRVAEVTHALLEASSQHGSTPLRASEVMIYDARALSARATGVALSKARRHGLAHGWSGLWFPTELARDLRSALEDRVLDAQVERD